MRSTSALVACVVAVGCGSGGGNAPHDSVPIDTAPQPCWLDTYTPGGSVELGTGIVQYMPMPDTIELEYGTQVVGYDMPVSAQITGLVPGNANDPTDPANPRTRFHGFFYDTPTACGPGNTCATGQQCVSGNCLVPVNAGKCGARLGYVPASGSTTTYNLARSLAIPFDSSLKYADVQGRKILVVVEIIDSQGLYATAQKLVTCSAPMM
jgi:hypothetical protein